MKDKKDIMCMYIFSKSFEKDKGCTNSNCPYIHPCDIKSGLCKFVNSRLCKKHMCNNGIYGNACKNYHVESHSVHNIFGEQKKYDAKKIYVNHTYKIISCPDYICSYFDRTAYSLRKRK